MSGSQSADTRHRIERAALELFTEHGYSATSLQQIADRVGVSKAALYYYFKSKDELAQSIVRPTRHDIDNLLDEAEAAEHVDPREILGRFFDMLVYHGPIFAAMIKDGRILVNTDFASWTVEWLQRFQTILVGPDASLEDRARAIVAAGGLARSIILIREGSMSQVREAALDAACSALEVNGSGRRAKSGECGVG